jgi:hypothetical protein
MATIRIMTNPEYSIEQITQTAGAANVTTNIEITVNQAAIVTDASSTVSPRPISRKELSVQLRMVAAWLERDASITGFSDF